MAWLVVDTNVAVVANGTDDPPPGCIRACQRRLSRIVDSGLDAAVLDKGRGILGEYGRNLRPEGQTGAGDKFLKWVLTNQSNPERCAVVSLTPDSVRTFAEFPADPRLAGFHDDDRKFVALAVKHPDRPSILQALDCEWWGYREALADSGVTVDFLCSDDIEKLHERKYGGS